MNRCKGCNSTKLIRAGTHRNRKGLFQLWKCKRCGRIRMGEQLPLRPGGFNETN